MRTYRKKIRSSGQKGVQGAPGAVNTLTGSIVDNTDPTNPVISAIQVVKKALNANQLKALNSTPIVAVNAPGAGFAIEVISCSLFFDYGTTPFTSLTTIDLIIDTLTFPQSSFIYALAENNDNFERGGPVVPGVGDYTNVKENKALTIVGDADSAAGDSTATVYIFYRIIAL